METKKKPDIELRTTEIEELLGHPPGSMVRWGITIFFGILIVAIVFCSYVKYPKIITAPILITTENPASWVVAKYNGKIDSILVKNNDMVYSGQILAAISNSCRLSDALKLKDYLRSIHGFIYTLDMDSLILCNEDFILGELQQDFSHLNRLINEYSLFKSEKLHEIAYKSLLEEKQEQELYYQTLLRQKKLYLQSEQIVRNKLTRDSTLYQNRVIQISDFDNTKQQFLSSRIESSRVDLSVNSTRLSIIQLENRINQTKSDYNSKNNEYRNAFMSVYELLLAKLSIWEENFVLRAPTSGVVNYFNIWSSNQGVSVGEKVFAILSDNPGNLTGKCNIPVANIGNMAEDQSVIIKLDSYPFLEFGVIHGDINNISKIPVSQVVSSNEVRFVVAEVSLDQPLITSYQKRIPLIGELTGSAEIVIEDMTLIEHFISPLKHLFTNQIKSNQMHCK